MIGRLVALYPRGWRERYGAEAAALTRELVSAGQMSRLRAGLDLVAGAAAEWRRLAARQVNPVPAAAAAAGVTLVVRATAGGGARRPYFASHPAGWLLDLAELAWLLTVLPLALLAWRIRAEERALLATAGERYRSYATARRRMIPLIW